MLGYRFYFETVSRSVGNIYEFITPKKFTMRLYIRYLAELNRYPFRIWSFAIFNRYTDLFLEQIHYINIFDPDNTINWSDFWIINNFRAFLLRFSEKRWIKYFLKFSTIDYNDIATMQRSNFKIYIAMNYETKKCYIGKNGGGINNNMGLRIRNHIYGILDTDNFLRAYQYMRKIGAEKWIFIPLEIINTDIIPYNIKLLNEELSRREQFWLHRYKKYLINDPITLLSKIIERYEDNNNNIQNRQPRNRNRLITRSKDKDWIKMKCFKMSKQDDWFLITNKTLFSIMTFAKKFKLSRKIIYNITLKFNRICRLRHLDFNNFLTLAIPIEFQFDKKKIFDKITEILYNIYPGYFVRYILSILNITTKKTKSLRNIIANYRRFIDNNGISEDEECLCSSNKDLYNKIMNDSEEGVIKASELKDEFKDLRDILSINSSEPVYSNSSIINRDLFQQLENFNTKLKLMNDVTYLSEDFEIIEPHNFKGLRVDIVVPILKKYKGNFILLILYLSIFSSSLFSLSSVLSQKIICVVTPSVYFILFYQLYWLILS